MQSKASTVKEYLASLPEDRRSALNAIRAVIAKNIDKGFEEGMQYGMIGYYVPHATFPPGYHCDAKQPLPFAGLASQKGHMSLYIMAMYESSENADWFREAWTATGRKLDMGKCCVRFKRIEDVPLEVVGQAFKRLTLKKYIAGYLESLAKSGRAPKEPKASTASGTRAKAASKAATQPAAKPPSKSAATKGATKGAAKIAARASTKKAASASRAGRAAR